MVKATLPEKLIATWEPLSRKMASKNVQSRENMFPIKTSNF